jgi:hypothetical protein
MRYIILRAWDIILYYIKGMRYYIILRAWDIILWAWDIILCYGHEIYYIKGMRYYIILSAWDISLKFMKDCMVFPHALNNASIWWRSARRPKLVTLEITVHRINISLNQFVCKYVTKRFLKRINNIRMYNIQCHQSLPCFFIYIYIYIYIYTHIYMYIYIHIYIYTHTQNTTNMLQTRCKFLDFYCIQHSNTIKRFPYRGQSSILSSCNAGR